VYGKGLIVDNVKANIVSLSAIAKNTYVEYSHSNKGFKLSGKRIKRDIYFDLSINGLYVLRDTYADPSAQVLKADVSTARQLEAAKQARELCARLGHIGSDGIIRIIKSAAINNLPVTVEDVRRADRLLGPCIHCSMGKLTKPKDTTVPNITTEARHVDVDPDPEVLHADFVFIPGPNNQNTIVFITVGESRRLIVAAKTKDRSQKALEKAWDDILTPYLENRIPVHKVMTDNEASLGLSANYLAQRGIKLVQHASEQHEPVVERRVRTIKERMRSVLSGLSFDLPLRLYWNLLTWVIQGINITPDTLNTADDVRSARERVSGARTDAKTIRAAFGECVLYHSENNEECNLGQRSDIGIIVGRNLDSGSHFIWNPLTTSFVERRPFKTIPMPQTTKAIIGDVAKRDNPGNKGAGKKNLPRLQKSDHLGGGQYTRVPVEFRINQESDHAEAAKASPKQPNKVAHTPVPMADTVPAISPIMSRNSPTDESPVSPVPYTRALENDKRDSHQSLPNPLGPQRHRLSTLEWSLAPELQNSLSKGHSSPLSPHHANSGGATVRKGVLNDNDSPGNGTLQAYSPINLPTFEPSHAAGSDRDHISPLISKSRQPLSKTPKSGSKPHSKAPVAKDNDSRNEKLQKHSPRYPQRVRKQRDLTYFALSQMTISEALRTYPSEGRAAIQAELANLLNYEAIEPAPDGSSMAIPCKLFVKEKVKSDGTFDKLKGRLVAGGHKQIWDGEDNSSPTVGWETVLMALATAAKHNLHLTVADVTSAYLNAPAVKPVYMTLPPQITEELLQLRPDWRSFAGKGGTLCVKLKKALYGLKDSGKLWYNHISDVLIKAGFISSDHDHCLFKKLDGDKHAAMVLLYVDDILVIAKTAAESKKIIDLLENQYGTLTVQTGNSFSFVGTRITVNENGIKVDCKGSIDKLVAQYSAQGTSSNAPTPSNYSVKEESEEINNKVFHSLVMSIMYIGKRCRPDVLANAAYLSTKINNPSVRDLTAALKTLRYLNSSSEKGILFLKTRQQDLKLSCDAAFNVHCDAKSHTGAVVLAGGAPVYYKSSKQKSISKSSTEAEMIACDTGVDMLLHMAEIAEFMGFGVEYPITIEQDNKSAIFILERGRPTKKRAPIEVKYQYILENIQNGKVSIAHVPTEAMIADILTKMLHGNNFRKAAARLLF
jgi:hypothetical protein